MTKIFQSYYGILLVLWIAGGTVLMYYMSSTSLGQSVTAENILVRDGDFQIAVSEPVSYGTNKSEVRLSGEIQKALTILTDYLIERPDKQLVITGLYTAEESQRIADTNIGLHRAQNIKQRLVDMGANPGSLLLESKMAPYENQFSAIHGIQLNIIRSQERLNRAPKINASELPYSSKTTFLMPRYTRSFDKLADFDSIIEEYIEAAMETMNQTLVVTMDGDQATHMQFGDRLESYLLEVKEAPELEIIYNQVPSKDYSDRDKQILKFDIGLKRFQNYSKLFGS